MNIRDTFKNTKVAYLPVEGNAQKQQKTIKSQATYHGVKIKITTGLFVNPETCETIKLLRLELIGKLPKKPLENIKKQAVNSYRKKELIAEFDSEKRSKRVAQETELNKLIDLFLSGMTYQQIADKIGVTKQAVYSRIANRVRKLKREDQ